MTRKKEGIVTIAKRITRKLEDLDNERHLFYLRTPRRVFYDLNPEQSKD